MVTKPELIEIFKRAGIGEYIIQVTKDVNDNFEYIGKAAPGSDTSDPVWQIVKLSYDVDQDFKNKLYASGTKLFDKIFDDMTDYTYS